ncbi:putative large exoprotein [Azorhizobium caulinodans ORS 571]|uniref:Putative large exoprotein n=1 Tax=Azorhizobium caulinodans (strain ATCC 43989 / DSM 5975 / JCM 20966 / LMG 6465 / NBRC 14845 / NCIMB 13405 / ORS 571) TaxID=438753 RepID=A8I2R4_AZOC5|nr:MBG domain-containing protein [Azorhizobium caulinodans]BAF87919.1 putative large exoprotein [Azorhizobium caulinodans ORS 571]
MMSQVADVAPFPSASARAAAWTSRPAGRSARLVALLLATTALSAPAARGGELPTSGSVVSGSAAISVPSATSVLITQTSRNAIINWGSFSVRAGNAVRFENGSGATLNRVTGLSPSQIDGSLSATGSVYLVNPNGITVGPTGQVTTGGSFIASTHDVSDAEFNAGGAMTFRGSSTASVINYGSIGSLGGDVALIARKVENAGTISAPNGTVGLAAGYEVLVRDAALSDGKFVVKVGGGDTEAKTTGVIKAAEAELKANGGNVYALAGNTESLTKATGVASKGGRIFLTAGDGGNVTVTQKLSARAAASNGKAKGGEIRVSGGTVKVSGKLDAKGEGDAGGTIVVTGRDIQLAAGADLDASGATGGLVLVGGDYQGGKDATTKYLAEDVATATTTTVEAGASIRVDGTAGAGGRTVVWSDGTTRFDGTISATAAGTAAGGDAEVSGKVRLAFDGTADLRSERGAFGTLLLDPYNLTISAASGSGMSGFNANANNSVLNATTLTNALATANVTVTTGSAGAQAGDITVATPINWSSGSALTLSAYGSIAVNASITGGTGSSILLRADNTGTGTGTVTFGTGATLSAGGGVSIFYNPSSFAAPTDYSARVASGTLTAYMLVNTVQDLQDMNTNLNGIYALGRDIDASATTSWNGGAGFQPVGTNSSYFYGTLDGQLHVISGLFINRGSLTAVGLFGDLAPGAEIRNLGLVGGSVTGGIATGSLSGINHGIITNVYASSAVTGQDYVGGLIGYNTGTISQAYATGTVSGNDKVGGLIGINGTGAGNSTISNVYATGSVSGSNYVGGLIGANYGVLINAYSSGAVSASTSTSVGGLIGDNTNGVSITASFYNTQTTGQANGVGSGSSGGVTGLTTAQMRDGSTTSGGFYALASAAGWDFTTVWARPNALTSQSSDGQRHYAELYAVSGVVGVNATGTMTYGDASPAWTYTYYGTGSGYGNLVTANPAYASGVTSASDVGTYAVALSGGSGTSWGGRLTRFVSSGSVTVIPATLTVTANGGSMVYGYAAPALGYTASGWRNGQGDSLLSGVSVTTNATSTSNVGTSYTSSASGGSLSGAASGNYTLSYVDGSVSVTPRALTVTAGAQSMIYGDSVPGLTYALGGAGLVNGDTLTGALVTSASSTASVGSYAITQGTLAASSNYSVTYTGANVSVTARPLTVTADAQSMVYGDAIPGLTYAVGGAGLVNGDTLSGAAATGASSASGVGSYAITQGSLAASSNYALSYVGANLSVTPRLLTITADPKSMTYGDSPPGLTYGIGGAGLVNGDTLSGALATSASSSANVGTYAVTQGTLAASSNYAVTYTGANLAITPRAITIAADAQSMIYGDSVPVLTYTLGGAGLVNGDTLTGVQATSASSMASVGTYAITQGTLAASSNYAVTYMGANLAVTPRALTIAADARSMTYGASVPVLTYTLGGAGLVNGDTLTGVQATSASSTSGVGTYAITQGTLAASSNYAVTYSGAGLSVTPRPLTVTANATSMTYGDGLPLLTYAIGGAGLVNGDTLSGGLTTSATSSSIVGPYAIGRGTLSASPNYALTYVGGALLVLPRPLTITADDQTRATGAPNPALSYRVGGRGLVNGDTLSGTLATSAGPLSMVGSYPITQGSLSAGANYALTYSPGTLTVVGSTQTPAFIETRASDEVVVTEATEGLVTAVDQTPQIVPPPTVVSCDGGAGGPCSLFPVPENRPSASFLRFRGE